LALEIQIPDMDFTIDYTFSISSKKVV